MLDFCFDWERFRKRALISSSFGVWSNFGRFGSDFDSKNWRRFIDFYLSLKRFLGYLVFLV